MQNYRTVHKCINTTKKIDTIARTKIYRKVNRRQKILRQHTASPDKKKYFDSTLFRY